jgi:hypothetical protein
MIFVIFKGGSILMIFKNILNFFKKIRNGELYYDNWKYVNSYKLLKNHIIKNINIKINLYNEKL